MNLQRRHLLCASFVLAGFLPAPGQAQTRAGRVPGSGKVPPRGAEATLAPLVVLDPGHGGKDPGCIGGHGTQEKHVSLAIGLEVRRLLLAERFCRVSMTRAGDVFIPLEERVAIAERHKAALFVSIHENSCSTPSISGASVYTDALHASDPDSARLAAVENSADRFGGPKFPHYAPDVSRILRSLLGQETRLHSAELQHQVINRLAGPSGLLADPARHARFAVLQAGNIPSVLVETGFLSNPREEARLGSRRHQMRVAAAIGGAIRTYLAGDAQAGWVGE
jgi:N-acetylmuramoyl-L-alanine amidase